jgi:hypothetical protein
VTTGNQSGYSGWLVADDEGAGVKLAQPHDQAKPRGAEGLVNRR